MPAAEDVSAAAPAAAEGDSVCARAAAEGDSVCARAAAEGDEGAAKGGRVSVHAEGGTEAQGGGVAARQAVAGGGV